MKTSLLFIFSLLSCVILAQKRISIDSLSVLFETNQSVIPSESSLLKRINRPDNRVNRIQITAYTDSVGSFDFNTQLASKRLKAAYQLLAKSSWNNLPIDTINANEQFGRRFASNAKNRRVDIVFISEQVEQPAPVSEIKPVLNTAINLQVNFEGGKAVFLPSAYPNLNKLLRILLEDTSLCVQLDGHVCCADDYPLSLKRAQAVQNYLVDYGVDPKRIKSAGFSNSRRLYFQETTEEIRSANRRVEAILSRH
jgi:outer membrane protein OmpA-like peptidoglycan-associated protein